MLDVELKERLPMTETDTAPTLPYLATLEQIIADVVAPTAIDIESDRHISACRTRCAWCGWVAGIDQRD